MTDSDEDADGEADTGMEGRLVNWTAARRSNASWHSRPGYANRTRPHLKRPRDEEEEDNATDNCEVQRDSWHYKPCGGCTNGDLWSEMGDGVEAANRLTNSESLSPFHKALLARHYECDLS